MFFRDRRQAGKLLAERLSCFKKQSIVVYAIPRGGVVVAAEVASYFNAPLDLIITHKIGHPFEEEYAIAAISEDSHILGDQNSLASLENNWLQNAILTQREEIKRRREKYLSKREQLSPEGKIAILVDDGVATGYTFRVAIQELKTKHPAKIIAAVPVIPKETADIVRSEVDGLIALTIPLENEFLGSIGSYYEQFSQVEDDEVITLLNTYGKQSQKTERQFVSQSMIDPTLFTFPSYNYIARELINVPNITRGDFTLKRYPNRELHIKLDSRAAERECIVLGSLIPPESNLISFLLLCHTLQKENAYKITALIPYLSYSRHDKKESLKSYATDMIGKLLSASGVNEVITIDLHSIHDKELFPIPLISLSPAKIFADEIRKLHLTDATIVAPDEGAKRRAKAVAKEAGITRPISYAVKKRTADNIELVEFHGKVTKRAIVIDDMIDTGQTLITTCKKLQERGVEEITIMVTHGLFTGNAWKKLWNLGVTRIYCTDTIPLPKRITDKIHVLSIIPLLTEELQEEYKGTLTADVDGRYNYYEYDQP